MPTIHSIITLYRITGLMNYLEDYNLFENTIFVFTSDHGNCVGAHNQITKSNFREESFGIPSNKHSTGKYRAGK